MWQGGFMVLKKIKRYILVLLIKFIEFLEDTKKDFWDFKLMRYTIILFLLMMFLGGYLTR